MKIIGIVFLFCFQALAFTKNAYKVVDQEANTSSLLDIDFSKDFSQLTFLGREDGDQGDQVDALYYLENGFYGVLYKKINNPRSKVFELTGSVKLPAIENKRYRVFLPIVGFIAKKSKFETLSFHRSFSTTGKLDNFERVKPEGRTDGNNLLFLSNMEDSVGDLKFVDTPCGEAVHVKYSFGLTRESEARPVQTKKVQFLGISSGAAVSYACDGNFGPMDADQDGILDDVDECMFDAEDVDLFEDEDGCPELDNDKDGVLDVEDECPNDAESRDENGDSIPNNGCPIR